MSIADNQWSLGLKNNRHVDIFQRKSELHFKTDELNAALNVDQVKVLKEILDYSSPRFLLSIFNAYLEEPYDH